MQYHQLESHWFFLLSIFMLMNNERPNPFVTHVNLSPLSFRRGVETIQQKDVFRKIASLVLCQIIHVTFCRIRL